MSAEGERTEEEDVFLDAKGSPDAVLVQGLRRLTRKRKSISEDTEVEDLKTPKADKRHRPLGKMGGIQRSPEHTPTGTKKTGRTTDRRQSTIGPTGASVNAGPALTIETDPPTAAPTPEQLVLLGGMRAVLKDELGKTEARLTNRITEVEAGCSTLREEMRGLEGRLDAIEERIRSNMTDRVGDTGQQIPSNISIAASSNMSNANARLARYWKARCSLRLWPVKGEGEDMKIELQKFMTHKLRLGEDILTDTRDCAVRRIPSNQRDSRIVHEVTVEFPSVELRELQLGQPAGGWYQAGDPPPPDVQLQSFTSCFVQTQETV